MILYKKHPKDTRHLRPEELPFDHRFKMPAKASNSSQVESKKKNMESYALNGKSIGGQKKSLPVDFRNPPRKRLKSHTKAGDKYGSYKIHINAKGRVTRVL